MKKYLKLIAIFVIAINLISIYIDLKDNDSLGILISIGWIILGCGILIKKNH